MLVFVVFVAFLMTAAIHRYRAFPVIETYDPGDQVSKMVALMMVLLLTVVVCIAMDSNEFTSGLVVGLLHDYPTAKAIAMVTTLMTLVGALLALSRTNGIYADNVIIGSGALMLYCAAAMNPMQTQDTLSNLTLLAVFLPLSGGIFKCHKFNLVDSSYHQKLEQGIQPTTVGSVVYLPGNVSQILAAISLLNGLVALVLGYLNAYSTIMVLMGTLMAFNVLATKMMFDLIAALNSGVYGGGRDLLIRNLVLVLHLTVALVVGYFILTQLQVINATEALLYQ